MLALELDCSEDMVIRSSAVAARDGRSMVLVSIEPIVRAWQDETAVCWRLRIKIIDKDVDVKILIRIQPAPGLLRLRLRLRLKSLEGSRTAGRMLDPLLNYSVTQENGIYVIALIKRSKLMSKLLSRLLMGP